MPKLWNETIEAHRQAVRQATLDVTAALLTEHGLRSVTMSRIAGAAGIGRATLYKYFPDVEAVLLAWHEREIHKHLRQLEEARDGASTSRGRLEAVLTTYAVIVHESYGRHDADLAAFVHRDEHMARGMRHLRSLMAEVLADAAAAGDVRDDVTRDELAIYCMHAITGARELKSRASVRRLVAITMSGLHPQT